MPATDKEALEAFQLCTKAEGIIPALEPAHALAFVTKLAPTLPKDNLLVMNMCGRGDKDIFAVADHLGMKMYGSSFTYSPQSDGVGARLPPRTGLKGDAVSIVRFAALEPRTGRKALVTFVTAGDPDYATAKNILLGLPEAGADIIELGMPFSDPMADGPAMQASSLRALKAGQSMQRHAGDWCAAFRRARSGHAHRAHGLLQSDLHLSARAFPR